MKETDTHAHTHTHIPLFYKTVCGASKQEINLTIEPVDKTRYRALTCDFSTYCYQCDDFRCLLGDVCFTPNMKAVKEHG